MLRGTVKTWDDEAGRGVLCSPDLPGDVLAEAGAVRGRPSSLAEGAAVLFDYEAADQDGFGFRARWVRPRPVTV
jgi:CspA family cold shock protein